MTCSGVILLAFLYLTCYGLQYTKDVFLIHDMLQSSPAFSKPAISILQCAIICEADKGCVTYAYAHVNNRCFGYGNIPPMFKVIINKTALQTMTSFRPKMNGQAGCEENGYFLSKTYGRCWRYCTNRMKFNDAVQACKDIGGNMITHVVGKEAEFINSVHQKHGYTGGWYLGMTDREKEGTWRWLDGTRSFFKFPKGADNNYDGAHRGKGADCAVVHKTRSDLFDVYCGARYSFVCERRDLVGA